MLLPGKVISGLKVREVEDNTMHTKMGTIVILLELLSFLLGKHVPERKTISLLKCKESYQIADEGW